MNLQRYVRLVVFQVPELVIVCVLYIQIVGWVIIIIVYYASKAAK